jgi:uncharacterized RDD family membrane protein YckC
MTIDPTKAIPPEARAFQGTRAGIVTRVLANSVDFVVIVVAVALSYGGWVALQFLVDPTRFSFSKPQFFILLIVGAGYMITYLTIAWATTGRTYGAHLLGLRVVNVRGRKLHWVGAALRAVFCTTVPIGLFWAVVSNQNRSVQDVVLRTSVIYDWSTHGAQP